HSSSTLFPYTTLFRSRERLNRLRQADFIFTSELEKAGLLRLHHSQTGDGHQTGTAQAFAVLLPVQSVGVMGDQRTYQECIALRADRKSTRLNSSHVKI